VRQAPCEVGVDELFEAPGGASVPDFLERVDIEIPGVQPATEAYLSLCHPSQCATTTASVSMSLTPSAAEQIACNSPKRHARCGP
jgi:hypothetical protein